MPPTEEQTTALRWASGGGHPAGDGGGLHVATSRMGSLCGRFTPHTPYAVDAGKVCRTCARVAGLRHATAWTALQSGEAAARGRCP